MITSYDSLLKPLFQQEKVVLPFEKTNIDLSQTEVSFGVEKPTDIIVSFSNSKGEVFSITIFNNQLITDRRSSGNVAFSDIFALKAQVMPLKDKITSLHLIIDKSSVEILLNNGKYSMTNLMFPTEDYTNLNIITKDNTPITNLKLNTIARVWDIQN